MQFFKWFDAVQVKDLKEHNEYKFRIKAFNAIGVGDPGNSSSMIAKDPYGRHTSSSYHKVPAVWCFRSAGQAAQLGHL